jgi:DNA-binding CsgD family transcriptional regulator
MGPDNAMAVYRALLTAGGNPAELSAATGLPECAIPDVPGVLTGLRPARAASGTTSDAWQALRPGPGFAAQARQCEAELARLTRQLTSVQASLWSARLRHAAAPLEPLETWRDALAEARCLARHATSEYLLIMPAPPEQLAVAHSGLRLHETAVTRGIALKVLYHDSAHGDPKALAHARQAERAGAEVRTAPLPLPPIVISDRHIAVIPAGDDQPATAVRIRDPAIAGVISTMFTSTWDTAAPLTASATPGQPGGLSPAEQTLLRLLAAGHTDQAAASKLQMSLSTVSRQKKALMGKLQAISLFQAGVNAARNGWL